MKHNTKRTDLARIMVAHVSRYASVNRRQSLLVLYLAQAADKVRVHAGAGQSARIHRAAHVDTRRRQHREFARNVRVVGVHVVHDGH